MIEDELLHDALEARADGAPDSLANAARAVAVARPRATGWRTRLWRGRWAAAARLGATVAVASAVLAFLAIGPGRSTDPATPSEAGVSTSPAPAATADSGRTPRPNLSPWTTLTWSAGSGASFRAPDSHTYVNDSISWRGGWLAVGYSFADHEGRVTGRVWTSTDGLGWISQDGPWVDRQFDQVIEHDGEVVIVGVHRAPDRDGVAGAMSPAMWTSTDGVAWTEATLPDAMFGGGSIWTVAAGGQGWLVRANDLSGVDRWLLGDPGGDWRDVTSGQAVQDTAMIAAIAGTDDGWLAVGLTGWEDRAVNGPTHTTGAIWWSNDGERWTAAAVDRPGTSIGRIVQVAGGWIAIGTDNGGCGGCIGAPTLMWRSDDGRAWTAVDQSFAWGNSFGGTLLASDGYRGIAIDTDEGHLIRVRETMDGRTWSSVNTALAPGWDPTLTFEPRDPAVGPDGVLSISVSPEDRINGNWPVPYLAVPGDAPASAATQAPFPTEHDTVCLPVGLECGP